MTNRVLWSRQSTVYRKLDPIPGTLVLRRLTRFGFHPSPRSHRIQHARRHQPHPRAGHADRGAGHGLAGHHRPRLPIRRCRILLRPLPQGLHQAHYRLRNLRRPGAAANIKDAIRKEPGTTSPCLPSDNTGYKNLLQLVSKAHLEGFYYRPKGGRRAPAAAQLRASYAPIRLSLSANIPRLLIDGSYDSKTATARAHWYREVCPATDSILEAPAAQAGVPGLDDINECPRAQ